MNEDKDSILLQIGELRGTTKAHKDRLDQHAEELIGMRRDISEIKIGQEQMKSFFLQCMAEQNTLLISKLTELQGMIAAPKPNPASQVREFMESRPVTTAGLSSALGVVAYCFGVMVGFLPPPK